MTDDELTTIAQRRCDALCASFSQTRREVFDSSVAAKIFNDAFESLDAERAVLVWEG